MRGLTISLPKAKLWPYGIPSAWRAVGGATIELTSGPYIFLDLQSQRQALPQSTFEDGVPDALPTTAASA